MLSNVNDDETVDEQVDVVDADDNELFKFIFNSKLSSKLLLAYILKYKNYRIWFWKKNNK